MSFFEPGQFGGQLTTAEITWVEKAALSGLPGPSNVLEVFRVNAAGTGFELAANGSALTPLRSTETPDGVNQIFTFPSKPTYIINGGAWYLENDGWTWDSVHLKATLAFPPPVSTLKLLAFQ